MGTCHYDSVLVSAYNRNFYLTKPLVTKQNTCNLEDDMQFTLLLYNFDMIYDNVL